MPRLFLLPAILLNGRADATKRDPKRGTYPNPSRHIVRRGTHSGAKPNPDWQSDAHRGADGEFFVLGRFVAF